MKLVVVICAHTKSSSSAASALAPLVGRPMLARLVERVRAMTVAAEVVVATGIGSKDDPIAHLCATTRVAVSRSDAATDVDAQLRIARLWAADAIVSIRSSDVLIDPAVIDRVAGAYLEAAGRYDYASTLASATYPVGQRVEVASTAALDAAHAAGLEPEAILDASRVLGVRWERAGEGLPPHRFAVDHPGDYDFARAIFEELWTPARPVFSLDEILALLDANPEIAALDTSAMPSGARHDYQLAELDSEPESDVRPMPLDPFVTAAASRFRRALLERSRRVPA